MFEIICLWLVGEGGLLQDPKCRLAVCVCAHVCSGVQHPRPVSVGKSPLLLTVCLDTVYLCSDCRSRSGLCGLMYSSCSLVYLSSPAALSFFLSFSFSHSLPFTVCYSLSPHSSHTHTQTLTAHRGIRAPEHSCAYSHSSTHTCITHSVALRDIWLTISQTTTICQVSTQLLIQARSHKVWVLSSKWVVMIFLGTFKKMTCCKWHLWHATFHWSTVNEEDNWNFRQLLPLFLTPTRVNTCLQRCTYLRLNAHNCQIHSGMAQLLLQM